MIALLIALPWLYVFQLEPMELGSHRKVIQFHIKQNVNVLFNQ